jgi:hypothetical protein
MSTPNTTRSGVGIRKVQVFALDANGYPAAPSTAAYEGINVSGVKSVAVTDPAPRIVTYFGDDRPQIVDILPATEPITAEMTVSKINDTIDAAVQGGPKSFAVGEMEMYPVRTNHSGDESQVGVVAYQQAIDSDRDAPIATSQYGKRYWNAYIFPKAWLFPRAVPFDENPTAQVYTVQPQFCKKHLWGTALAEATEGAVDAQAIRVVSEYKPHFVAFKGDGATTSFTLATNAQATAKMKVWVDGVLQVVASAAVTTSAVAFTSAPTTGAIVVSSYEVV